MPVLEKQKEELFDVTVTEKGILIENHENFENIVCDSIKIIMDKDNVSTR